MATSPDRTDQKVLMLRGVRVPRVGLGTWQLTGRAGREAMKRALGLGYRHLDTAEMYGNEGEVGAAMRESGLPREQVFLVSKVSPGHLQRAGVLQACEGSLRRLGTDYLDLYLIHWPNARVPIAETVSALAELQQRGWVQRFGVSNFSTSQLDEALQASGGAVFCDQVEYHPFHPQRTLIEACADAGILLTAYSPLDRGRAARSRELQEIGRRHGKTASQVALRWLLQQPNVVVIPKASGRRHQEENLQIFDFDLSREEMETIASLA